MCYWFRDRNKECVQTEEYRLFSLTVYVLPVESSKVQLQCVFLRLCSSPGSQVLPVKILPVVGQALIMLYVWTDATHSSWQKQRHSSHFTELHTSQGNQTRMNTLTSYVYLLQ